jgi:HEAT repeat protein
MLLALARIGHPSSRDLFRQHLSDADPVWRRAAAEGLGRVRDRDSVPALKSMMATDPSSAVRLAATFAIGLIEASQSHVLAAAMASAESATQAREYLLELGAAAIPGVQAALGVASGANGRADLLHLLGFIGTHETLALVQPYASDPNERVRRAAQNAAARLAART